MDPLCHAVVEGNIESVSNLLRQFPNSLIDDYNIEGCPLLYIAASKGCLEIVRKLLEAGATVDIAEQNGDPPLHIATQNGHLDIVRVLLKNGADPKKCRKDGDPPLVEATLKKYYNIVCELLEHGAVVGACRCDGDPPLVIATQNDDTETVLKLLEYKPDVNACKVDGDPPLIIATKNNNLKIVRALLKAEANVDSCWRCGDPSLVLATLNNSIEIVQELLIYNPRVNACCADGSPPLAIAVQNGNLDLVTILLRAGADINVCYIEGVAALVFAARHNRFDIVCELLKYKSNANANFGCIALFYAAKFGNYDAACNFLEKKEDVVKSNDNEITKPCVKDVDDYHINGENALMEAAKNGHSEIVSLLIKYDADITRTNSEGNTPLHLAAKYGHTKVVSILCQNGANVLQQNLECETSLTIAAKYGHSHTVLDLINTRPDLTHNIESVLSAAEMGHIEVIKQFKNTGVDINAALNGITPMDMAVQNGRLGCVTDLISLGSEVHFRNISSAIRSNHFLVAQELLRSAPVHILDDKMKLLKYVTLNDEKEIKKLVSNGSLLLEEYEEFQNLSILEIACYQWADIVKWETIKLLLDNGSNPNRTFKLWQNKCAIHFAAMGQNITILEHIVNTAEINANALGKNALLVLLLDAHPKETFEQCVRILCKTKIDIKREYQDKTAIIFAVEKKYVNTVDILLSYLKNVTPKEDKILKEHNARLVYEVRAHDVRTVETSGEDFLTNNDEDGFIAWLENHGNYTNENGSSYLQIACEKSLNRVATHLIKLNPNEVGSKNILHPLVIAIHKGNYRLVELILGIENLVMPKNVLNEALKHVHKQSHDSDVDYVKTCEHVFRKHELNENENDSENNNEYPLHYAVKYASADFVSKLLQRNASLANRDKFGNLTIKGMDYDVLKNHFDSCIKLSKSGEEKEITFDYTTLVPTNVKLDKKLCYYENDNEKTHLIEREEKKVLPCIETDAILHMACNIKQKYLLQHPLIKCFLDKKWQKLRFLYFWNVSIYLLFCILFWCFIGINYNKKGNIADNYWNVASYILLYAATIVICLRECFQIIYMKLSYFKNADNYLEMAIVFDVFYMLFRDNMQPMIAIAILLSTLELLFLIGKAPGMSTYVVMLRTVSYNFIKFLSFSAILIIAFAFAFYTIFRDLPSYQKTLTEMSESVTVDKNDSLTSSENDNKFFDSLPLALFKSLVMLSGEIEASSLNLNQYPFVSHVIVICFIFLIAIILVNLLNGLAVSDTQKIKQEAKLIALVSQAEYLAYIESVIFNPGFQWSLQAWLQKKCSITYELRGEPIRTRFHKKPKTRCGINVPKVIQYSFSNIVSDTIIETAKSILLEREARNRKVDPIHEEIKVVKQMIDALTNHVKILKSDLNKINNKISTKRL